MDGVKSFANGLHDYAQVTSQSTEQTNAPWGERCACSSLTSIRACFVCIAEHLMYLSVRDPLVDGLGSSNEHGVSVLAQQGTTRVSPALYGALTAAFAPDIVASISDEVPTTVASNRARKASQRSVMWVDDMQAAMKTALAAKKSSASAAVHNRRTLFFASVQGGADMEQRRTSCTELARRAADAEAAGNTAASIDGFVIGGLGSGEDAIKREEIIRHVVVSAAGSSRAVLLIRWH